MPVRSEEPPVESSRILFFSFAIWLTASITDDVGTFFDVVVRAYKNGDPIAEGTLDRLAAKRTDAVAKVITLTVDEDTTFAAGD